MIYSLLAQVLCLPFCLIFLGRLHKVPYDSPLMKLSRQITQPFLRIIRLVFPIILRVDLPALVAIVGIVTALHYWIFSTPMNMVSWGLIGIDTLKYLSKVFYGLVFLALVFTWFPGESSLRRLAREFIKPYHFFILKVGKSDSLFWLRASYFVTIMILIIGIQIFETNLYLLEMYLGSYP